MVHSSKKFPEFASWEKEEKFWETHSTVDYPFEDIPPEEHLRLNPRRRTRRRMREVSLKNPFAA
jgi:hypothetical protein